MADRIMFIGWATTVRGREERALEDFNETMGLYGRLQQEGRIEKFDVALLDPSGGGLDGYIVLHGSAEQLNALREDDEWRRNMIDAQLIVEDLRICLGATNSGVAEEMARYQEAIAKVPQSA